MIRHLDAAQISAAVTQLSLQAARHLPADVGQALSTAGAQETAPLARHLLQQCQDNARIAAKTGLPLCQDTGLDVVFVELGQDLHIDGGSLTQAIAEGLRQGNTTGHLRASMVADPLFERRNTGDNSPATIHLELVPGDHLRLILAPKGGGSENMSALHMLTPAAGRAGVMEAVVATVAAAGGNPCPPTIVGVGLGGSAEQALLAAKKALLRPLGQTHQQPEYASLESELLHRINALGIGPQGLGGATTALAVHIIAQPCHIASLPVGICLQCHVARHAEVVL